MNIRFYHFSKFIILWKVCETWWLLCTVLIACDFLFLTLIWVCKSEILLKGLMEKKKVCVCVRNKKHIFSLFFSLWYSFFLPGKNSFTLEGKQRHPKSVLLTKYSLLSFAEKVWPHCKCFSSFRGLYSYSEGWQAQHTSKFHEKNLREIWQCFEWKNISVNLTLNCKFDAAWIESYLNTKFTISKYLRFIGIQKQDSERSAFFRLQLAVVFKCCVL